MGMLASGIALGGVILSLPVAVVAEIVTITAYPTTCRAIYTTVTASSIFGNGTITGTEPLVSIHSTLTQHTGTQPATEQSSTIISTVTVSPTPISDAALNSGSVPFVLVIPPGAPSRRRQASQPTYIDADGYITANASQAVQYVIDNGTLASTSGGWVSTNEGVENMPFAISPILGTISTLFAFESLKLQWNNSAFTGGQAEFYTVPANTSGANARVVVRLAGPPSSDWAPVNFEVQPAAGLVIESASTVTSSRTSTGLSAESSTASTSAAIAVTTDPPTGNEQVTPTSMVIPSSTTANVAPSGTCGPEVGFSCYGAYSGNCCSSYGFCGSGTEYCGVGCQPGYGICDTLSASSSDNEAASATPYPLSVAQSSSESNTGIATSTNIVDTSAPISSSGPTPPAASATFASAVSPLLSPSQYANVSNVSSVMSSSQSVSGGVNNTLPVYSATAEPLGPTTTPSPAAYVNSQSSSAISSAYLSASSSSSSSIISIIDSAPLPVQSSVVSVAAYSTTSTTVASTTSTSSLLTSTSALIMAYSASPTSSSSSSSSASSSYLVLTSPTPCYFGDPTSFDEDDSYERIDLPQAMYIGTSSNTATFAAVNGLLSITVGSAQYQYAELPSTNLPNGTVAPYWADLAIYRSNVTGPPQGLFYQLDTTGITYEWYLNRAGNRAELFHFTVQYLYASPGIFTYTYYDVGDGEDGALATVGLQTSTTSGYTMSYNSTGSITPGLVVTCDTNQNTCTRPAPSYGRARK